MIQSFTLLKKTGEQCYPFKSCRAYVGQKISPNIDSIDGKSIQIEVSLSEGPDNHEHLQKILNDFEEKLEIKKTVIEKDENTLKITGSRWWAIANPAVSLYTLLLRLYSKVLERNDDYSLRTVPADFKIGEDIDLITPYRSKFTYITNDAKDYIEIYQYILPFMQNLRNIFGSARKPNYELGSADEYALNFTGINSFLLNSYDPNDPNSNYVNISRRMVPNSTYYNNYCNWLQKKRQFLGV